VFGFLFWELKENWRLYRKNRSPVLKPVMVGHHGENVLQLLRPGFHSGTVPRIYDKLRHAERQAIATGQWRVARAYKHQLHEVAEAVRLFLERDFLVLLLQSSSWKNQPLRTGKIELATRLIRIELEHDAYPDRPLCLALLEKAGWLVAQVERPGWLWSLSPPQLATLTAALVGMYKFAGVDLVREQVELGLANTGCEFDIQAEGLVVRSLPEPDDEVVCPMYDTIRLAPGQKFQLPGERVAVPPLENLIFARLPVKWQRWVQAWQEEQKNGMPSLLPGANLLPPPPVTELAPVAERAELPPVPVLSQPSHASGNGPVGVRE
jgi:hypothetical protein